MKLKNYFIITCILILITAATIFNSAAASVFKDQGEIDKLPWAKAAIQIMADKSIITGMDGGYFNPNTSVKKLDALIITAKVLGAVDENKAELDKAEADFGSKLAKYSLPYGKREIAYLLYSNVLAENELDEYIGTSNIKTAMKRHEAAVLLVKALGKEQEVKNKTLVILPFVDQDVIPDKARPYVDYLQKQKIMSGTSDTEFSPLMELNRAQMSVLLSKVMALLPERVVKEEKPNVIKQGYISSISTSILGNTLTVRATIESGSTAVEYVIPSTAEIYKNGILSHIGELDTGDPVSLEMNSTGTLLKISAKSKTRTVNGTIKSIIMDHPINLVVSSGNLDETIQLADRIEVSRNNGPASFRDLRVGDNVKIELTYDKAENINAAGTINTLDAVLEEMVIAAVPRISVKDSENNVKQYFIIREPVININGEAKTFYDLRVGMKLKLSLDSETVVRLDAEKPKTVENLTGVIEVYNDDLNVVTLNIPAASTVPTYKKQLFFKTGSIMVTNAKTGKVVSLDALKPGISITAYGNNEMGVFVVTQIIIISD